MSSTSKTDYREGQYLQLIGIRAPVALGEYFDSSMIDVAYLFVEGESLKVETDVGIDLRDPSDRDWFLETVRHALDECAEGAAEMRVVIDGALA